MRRAFETAKRDGAEWIIFPEGALSGYTADFDAAFVSAAFDRARAMCREAGVYAVIGTSWEENGRKQNQVRIVDPQGKFVGAYSKICLTYDEAKGFVPGESIYVAEAGGVRFGTLICNDLWVTPGFTDGPDPRLRSNYLVQAPRSFSTPSTVAIYPSTAATMRRTSNSGRRKPIVRSSW